MSAKFPTSSKEWANYISTLSGEQLRSKAIAANSIRFVQELQADRLDPDSINHVFRLLARQFVATGQEPPSDGYVDLKQIAETDPEIQLQYQTFVAEDDMANRQRLTNTLNSKWGATLKVASNKEAKYSDSYQKHFDAMKAHAPKVEKHGDYWSVSVWSVSIDKYMGVAEWKDKKLAEADLTEWKKAHLDTLRRLEKAMKEKGADASPDKSAAEVVEGDIDSTPKRVPGGLYEYPKSIQAAVESSNRKLKRAAMKAVRNAYEKDRRVVGFLNTHVKRAKSAPARALLAAMAEAYPVLASLGAEGGHTVEAGKKRYGLYGYPAKVASLGLQACSQVREQAGHIASDLHRRKASQAERIIGFLSTHGKKARCQYSRMLRMAYPDPQMKLAAAAKEATPGSVSDWLDWEG